MPSLFNPQSCRRGYWTHSHRCLNFTYRLLRGLVMKFLYRVYPLLAVEQGAFLPTLTLTPWVGLKFPHVVPPCFLRLQGKLCGTRSLLLELRADLRDELLFSTPQILGCLSNSIYHCFSFVFPFITAVQDGYLLYSKLYRVGFVAPNIIV